MRMIHSPRLLPALPLLLVGALVACGGDPYAAPGEKVDQAIASRLRQTDNLQADGGQAWAAFNVSADRSASRAAQAEEDAATQAAVNAKLATDRSLSRFDMDVEVHAGSVVLSGTVPDASARKRAARLAAAALGVTAVDNRLAVR